MATEPVVPQEAIVPTVVSGVSARDFDDPAAAYLNTALFEQLQRVARLMSGAKLVPEHLRGQDKLSDCFLVVAQAFRWGMDPFAVAQHTFVTGGKLGYEGKIVAALINTCGRLESPLRYVYSGDKGTVKRTVRVIGRLKGEAEDREVEGDVETWRTTRTGSPWVPGQYDQMLAYRGSREWARRYMPEAVLGVFADDEQSPERPAIVEVKRVPALARATEQLQAEAPVGVAAETPEPAPKCDKHAAVELKAGECWKCSAEESERLAAEKAAEPKPRQRRIE